MYRAIKFISSLFLVDLQMLVYEFMPNGTLRDWLSGMETVISYALYYSDDLICSESYNLVYVLQPNVSKV